jgi:hypothetical protein
MRDGELVDKRLAAPLHRADQPRHHVISDTMDAIRSMADGQMYDSKSVYRKGLKANGCFEVGNDPLASRPPDTDRLWNSEPVEVSMRRAFDQLRSR